MHIDLAYGPDYPDWLQAEYRPGCVRVRNVNAWDLAPAGWLYLRVGQNILHVSAQYVLLIVDGDLRAATT